MFRVLPGVIKKSMSTKASSVSSPLSIEKAENAVLTNSKAFVDQKRTKLPACPTKDLLNFVYEKKQILLPSEIEPHLLRILSDITKHQQITDFYYKNPNDMHDNIHNGTYTTNSKCKHPIVAVDDYLVKVLSKSHKKLHATHQIPQVHCTSHKGLAGILSRKELKRGQTKSGIAAQSGIFSTTDYLCQALVKSINGKSGTNMVFFFSDPHDQHSGRSAITAGDTSTLRYDIDSHGNDIDHVPIDIAASYDSHTARLTIHNPGAFIENQLANLVCFYIILEPVMAINLATLLHEFRVPLNDKDDNDISAEMLQTLSTKSIHEIIYNVLAKMYHAPLFKNIRRSEHLDSIYEKIISDHLLIKEAIMKLLDIPEIQHILNSMPKYNSLMKVIQEEVVDQNQVHTTSPRHTI